MTFVPERRVARLPLERLDSYLPTVKRSVGLKTDSLKRLDSMIAGSCSGLG